jgi:two-component system sensor histidine kinase KdpD
VLGGALITLVLVPYRSDLTPSTPSLLLVVPVVIAGLLGGRRVAIPVAAGAALCVNYFFLAPYGSLKVDVVEDLIALAAFAVVAVVVGVLAANEGDRRRVAERRAKELEQLNHQLQTTEAARADLAQEVDRLAVLRDIDVQRAAMLRSVSHDLRTPLASIRAAASDLRAGTAYDKAARSELVALIDDEAGRLDRLVENLLDLSRIEAGGLRPRRAAVDLADLVAGATRRLDHLFDIVRVEVAIPPDLPLLSADQHQIGQVLTNLLENAARHAPVHSTVRVRARQQGELVKVTVSDEGQGVQRFERDRIFEPFQRGDARSGTGTGIGLAICKAFVTANGGTIDVQAAPSVGACFAFTVPVHDG